MIHIFKAITLPRSPRRNRHAVVTTPKPLRHGHHAGIDRYVMATTSESLRRRRYGTTSATRPLRHDRCSTTAPPQSLCFDRHDTADTIRPARYDRSAAIAATRQLRRNPFFFCAERIEQRVARTPCESPACGLSNTRVDQLEDRAACESPALGSSDMRVDQHSGQATRKSATIRIKRHEDQVLCGSSGM